MLNFNNIIAKLSKQIRNIFFFSFKIILVFLKSPWDSIMNETYSKTIKILKQVKELKCIIEHKTYNECCFQMYHEIVKSACNKYTTQNSNYKISLINMAVNSYCRNSVETIYLISNKRISLFFPSKQANWFAPIWHQLNISLIKMAVKSYCRNSVEIILFDIK